MKCVNNDFWDKNYTSPERLFRQKPDTITGHFIISQRRNLQGGPAKVRSTYIFLVVTFECIVQKIVIHKNIIINSKANKYQQNY